MSLEEKCDQLIEILDLVGKKGRTGAAIRQYKKTRTILCHIEPMDAVEVLRLRLTAQDISHRLWFAEDPHINLSMRLYWRSKDFLLRPSGSSIDLHGLGRVWTVAATLFSIDNEDMELIDG